MSRTGVQVYQNADGTTRREYRPPAEVFSADSLASLEGAPVTNDHPRQMVNGENVRQFQVGTALRAGRPEGRHVASDLVVQDAQTVRDIRSGKVELSCGYSATIVPTPGVSPEGEAYDAIQTNIRINHVAIVERGRAGHEARLRLDSAEGADTDVAYQVDAAPEEVMDEEKMKQLLAKLAAESARADAAQADVTALQGRLAAETARADALQADLATRLDAAAQIPALVAARVKLEREAGPHLDGQDVTAMTDGDIMRAVVKRVDNFDVPADAHPAYLLGRYEPALARATAAGAARSAFVQIQAGKIVDATPVTGEGEAQRRALENLDKQHADWRAKGE